MKRSFQSMRIPNRSAMLSGARPDAGPVLRLENLSGVTPGASAGGGEPAPPQMRQDRIMNLGSGTSLARTSLGAAGGSQPRFTSARLPMRPHDGAAAAPQIDVGGDGRLSTRLCLRRTPSHAGIVPPPAAGPGAMAGALADAPSTPDVPMGGG